MPWVQVFIPAPLGSTYLIISMRVSDSKLWRVLRFFQLHKLYRLVKGALPNSVVNVVSDVTMQNVYVPLVMPTELEPKYRLAWQRLKRLGVELGDYLEFGVSRGSSMVCMHRALKKEKIKSVRLFGFDSFEGMPESAANEDLGTWVPGQFASSLEQTTQFLDEANIDWKRTHLIKGWFDDTLNSTTTAKHNIRKASVIMIDCDIYSASKTALNYSLPMINDYAVIFFDDWKDDITFGEYKAYDEFLRENKQLKSEPFGDYPPTGKIFFVTNTAKVAI